MVPIQRSGRSESGDRIGPRPGCTAAAITAATATAYASEPSP